MAENGPDALGADWTEFLRSELSRNEVWFSVRVVDMSGVMRISEDQALLIGKKAHLYPKQIEGLQTMEISGTVHRVGLDRLWARL